MATVEIRDWNDLNNVSLNNNDYVLMNDLDSNTAGYSGIGDDWDALPLQTEFDGNGYEIRDLVISADSDQQGLFSYTRTNNDLAGYVHDLTVDATITAPDTGNNYGQVAIIVGKCSGGTTVEDCTAEGLIEAHVNGNDIGYRVGGVVGDHRGDIYGCDSKVTIENGGADDTGGVVGRSYGYISETVSNAELVFRERVDAGRTSHHGGFVGYTLDGDIENCKSLCGYQFPEAASDNDGAYSRTGGFVGYHSNDGGTATISYCTVGSTEVKTKGRQCGGFAGRSDADIDICQSFASFVPRDSRNNVGGFVGYCGGGEISNSYFRGQLDIGSGFDKVGGFAGGNGGTISSSATFVDSFSSDNGQIGGFVGSNGGNIVACATSTDVTGYSRVGGFVGSSGGGVTLNCYSLGDATATAPAESDAEVGGFAGSLTGGKIDRCYSTGTSYSVNGADMVGGFVGRYDGATIRTDVYYNSTPERNSAGVGNAGSVSFTTINGANRITAVPDEDMEGQSAEDAMPALFNSRPLVEYNFRDGEALYSTLQPDFGGFDSVVGYPVTEELLGAVQLKIRGVGLFKDSGRVINGGPEIQDWNDLYAIRNRPFGNFELQTTLTPSTTGYDDVVGESGMSPAFYGDGVYALGSSQLPTGADVGGGWVGNLSDPLLQNPDFDGNGYTIEGFKGALFNSIGFGSRGILNPTVANVEFADYTYEQPAGKEYRNDDEVEPWEKPDAQPALLAVDSNGITLDGVDVTDAEYTLSGNDIRHRGLVVKGGGTSEIVNCTFSGVIDDNAVDGPAEDRVSVFIDDAGPGGRLKNITVDLECKTRTSVRCVADMTANSNQNTEITRHKPFEVDNVTVKGGVIPGYAVGNSVDANITNVAVNADFYGEGGNACVVNECNGYDISNVTVVGDRYGGGSGIIDYHPNGELRECTYIGNITRVGSVATRFSNDNRRNRAGDSKAGIVRHKDGGEIHNCFFGGNISGGRNRVGGVVARYDTPQDDGSPIMTNCGAAGRSIEHDHLYSDNYIGGLVGELRPDNSNGEITIERCYSAIEQVVGYNYVSNFIGSVSGQVKFRQIYAGGGQERTDKGKEDSTNNFGSVAAQINGDEDFVNSYWNSQPRTVGNRVNNVSGGTQNTANNLNNSQIYENPESNMGNFDFTDVWEAGISSNTFDSNLPSDFSGGGAMPVLQSMDIAHQNTAQGGGVFFATTFGSPGLRGSVDVGDTTVDYQFAVSSSPAFSDVEYDVEIRYMTYQRESVGSLGVGEVAEVDSVELSTNTATEHHRNNSNTGDIITSVVYESQDDPEDSFMIHIPVVTPNVSNPEFDIQPVDQNTNDPAEFELEYSVNTYHPNRGGDFNTIDSPIPVRVSYRNDNKAARSGSQTRFIRGELNGQDPNTTIANYIGRGSPPSVGVQLDVVYPLDRDKSWITPFLTNDDDYVDWIEDESVDDEIEVLIQGINDAMSNTTKDNWRTNHDFNNPVIEIDIVQDGESVLTANTGTNDGINSFDLTQDQLPYREGQAGAYNKVITTTFSEIGLLDGTQLSDVNLYFQTSQPDPDNPVPKITENTVRFI